MNLVCSEGTWTKATSTVSTSHKAQTIGRTSHLYALRPLVRAASYRPGRHTTDLDMNLKFSHPHEASIGPIDHKVSGFPCTRLDWVLA